MSVNTEAYQRISREVAEAGARLVAITKQRSVEDILALYELGQRDFGENRVSELSDKVDRLPDDIRWHFIGHLQRNKVREMVESVELVHSGDSLRLLRELDKRAGAADRFINVLLQFHVAQEESKYGLTRTTGWSLMREITETPPSNLSIVGVMGMATYTDEQEVVLAEFQQLHDIFIDLKRDFFADQPTFRELSMGMSGDYPLALQKKSTLVRIGSALFR